MTRLSKFSTTICLVCIALPVIAADLPGGLIKVNTTNNPACVTWYTINNEAWCSTEASKEPPVDPAIRSYEKQKIQFDQRPWQAAWGKKTDLITTVEYVPAGENVEQWNELITSQFMPNLQDKFSPKQFVEVMIQQLKDGGFNPVITILSDTPDQVMFEFRITTPDNMIQDELQKVTRGKDGIYVLHYVIKKADMGEKNRSLWIKNLEASSIK